MKFSEEWGKKLKLPFYTYPFFTCFLARARY